MSAILISQSRRKDTQKVILQMAPKLITFQTILEEEGYHPHGLIVAASDQLQKTVEVGPGAVTHHLHGLGLVDMDVQLAVGAPRDRKHSTPKTSSTPNILPALPLL